MNCTPSVYLQIVSGALCVLALFIHSSSIIAQCETNGPPSAARCGEAKQVCLLNQCYEMANHGTNDPHAGWCGPNTAVHTPHYFIVESTGTEVEIHILVGSCVGSSGLQAALIDSCEWSNANVLACDPHTMSGGTMELHASGLAPGRTYWILVDGLAGARCEFTFVLLDGVYQEQVSREIEQFSGDQTVCIGQDIWTARLNNPVAGAVGYIWEGLPWRSQGITTYQPELEISVPVHAPTGIFDICVYAFDGCAYSDTTCSELEIIAEPDRPGVPMIFCPEELQDGYALPNGEIVYTPGIYPIQFNTAEGCIYDSIFEINSLSLSPINDTAAYICEGEVVMISGEEFSATGVYDIIIESGAVTGCDSFVELRLFVQSPVVSATDDAWIVNTQKPVVLNFIANDLFDGSDAIGVTFIGTPETVHIFPLSNTEWIVTIEERTRPFSTEFSYVLCPLYCSSPCDTALVMLNFRPSEEMDSKPNGVSYPGVGN